MLEKQDGLESSSVSQTMTEIETLLCRGKVSNTLENNQEKQQPDYSDIPPELIELLRNPSIRALLTPPTQLEIEVKEMIQGKRPVPAIYPTDTIKDKQLPEKFLMDHYSKYLDADCLYLDQLRVIDRGLVKALENRAYKHKIDIPLKRENSRLDKFLNEVNQAIAEKIAVIGRGISTRLNKAK